MRNFVLLFCVCILSVSCDLPNESNGLSSEKPQKMGLLTRAFEGAADFTSAHYMSLSLGTRFATLSESISFLQDYKRSMKQLPERTYVLGYAPGERPEKAFLFLDQLGVVQVASYDDSVEWLKENGVLCFVVVKDQKLIDEHHAGEDPAPNFLTE